MKEVIVALFCILATGCGKSIQLNPTSVTHDTNPWATYNESLRAQCLEENRAMSAQAIKALCDERDAGPTTTEEAK
jgi:hypothetical protein